MFLLLILTLPPPPGEYYEYLESALDVLTCLTYYTATITPPLWSLFPLLYHAFDRWAYDYLENIISPVDNYISRSTDIFVTGSFNSVR